jgi:hypothetical protein
MSLRQPPSLHHSVTAALVPERHRGILLCHQEAKRRMGGHEARAKGSGDSGCGCGVTPAL